MPDAAATITAASDILSPTPGISVQTGANDQTVDISALLSDPIFVRVGTCSPSNPAVAGFRGLQLTQIAAHDTGDLVSLADNNIDGTMQDLGTLSTANDPPDGQVLWVNSRPGLATLKAPANGPYGVYSYILRAYAFENPSENHFVDFPLSISVNPEE